MPLTSRLFFFLRYLANPPWDTGITPPELTAFVASHPAGRALELGCGTGTNAIYLAKHGWQVTAVDFVASAITKARKKAIQEGVKIQFLVEDVARLHGITGPFDLILDIGCFHSLPDQEGKAYLRHVAQLLDQQGTFLLYSMISGSNNEFGLSMSDLEQMGKILELVQRQDGTDRGRRSAWLTWRKPVDQSAMQ